MSNTFLSLVIVGILICHLVAVVVGYKILKTTVLMSYVNAVVAISVFIFWTNKNLSIEQHYFDIREAFALGFEVCILIFALYSIAGYHHNTYVKVLNYIGFGLHVLVAIGMLLYILTFQMNTLF
jgi:predicted transporter